MRILEATRAGNEDTRKPARQGDSWRPPGPGMRILEAGPPRGILEDTRAGIEDPGGHQGRG